MCLGLMVVSCFKVPISGRRQINLLPESTMIGMSVTSYKEFLSQNPSLPTSDSQSQMVKNVGAKIKSPIDFLAGTFRILHIAIQNKQALIFLQRALGQMLFNPPNVAGWPGGKSWIYN